VVHEEMDLEPLKVKGKSFFATWRTTYPEMQHHTPEDLVWPL